MYKFFCQVWFLLSGPLMSIFLSTHSEKILSCVLRESSRNSSSPSNRFWVRIQAHLGTFYFVFSFSFFFFFICVQIRIFTKCPLLSFEKIKSRSSRNVQVACVLLSPNMWCELQYRLLLRHLLIQMPTQCMRSEVDCPHARKKQRTVPCGLDR